MAPSTEEDDSDEPDERNPDTVEPDDRNRDNVTEPDEAQGPQVIIIEPKGSDNE